MVRLVDAGLAELLVADRAQVFTGDGLLLVFCDLDDNVTVISLGKEVDFLLNKWRRVDGGAFLFLADNLFAERSV